MNKSIISYASTLLIFTVIDVVWIKMVMMSLYAKHLSHLLADEISYWPVLLFYILYPVGLCFFVVNPALKPGVHRGASLGRGFFFGIIAYGTYDLTNLATIRDWPLMIAIMDILWGGTVSAISAYLGVWFSKTVRS